MNKFLMGTSAIALAGVYAGQASATTWDVDVGGYGLFALGYASTDFVPNAAGQTTVADHDGVDTHQDVEIIFEPSITLENGLTFGLNVQLEGNTGGDQIDESYAFVRGSFGEVLIGNENSAGYKMTYGAPNVALIGVNSSSATSFVPYSGAAGGATRGADLFRGTLGSSYIEVDRNNDAGRITYFTPRFAGFQLGASYARDGNDDSNGQVNVNAAGALHDIFDIGANYVNSFNGFDVALSGRYGVGTLESGVINAGGNPVASASPSVWAVGLNLGAGGVTVGGSYAEMDGDGMSARDGTFYDIGVSYSTGPWGFSLAYSKGDDIDNESVTRNALGQIATAADETLTTVMAGVNYAVGPGVTAGIFGGYVDFDEDAFDTGQAGGDDLDGFLLGTGFRLSF